MKGEYFWGYQRDFLIFVPDLRNGGGVGQDNPGGLKNQKKLFFTFLIILVAYVVLSLSEHKKLKNYGKILI